MYKDLLCHKIGGHKCGKFLIFTNYVFRVSVGSPSMSEGLFPLLSQYLLLLL